MPSRPCLGPGPFHLAPPGQSRCERHALTPYANTAPMPKGWTTTRNRYLALHPICQWTGSNHPRCIAAATTVDHIVARAFGGSNDLGNLRSLCSTHAERKDREDSEEGKRRAKVRRTSRTRTG